MKHVFTGLMCAGLILSLGVLNANAAKSKPGKTSRLAIDNQPKEKTLTGIVAMSNDGKSFIIKVSQGFSGALWFLPASRFKYNEFEMLEVKAVCMVRGSTIVSVKTMEAVNKAAYEARLAELKADAVKKAEEKKNSQQKK